MTFTLRPSRTLGCAPDDKARGQLIKAREKLKLTRAELALKLGIGEWHLQKMEVGNAHPKYEQLQMWARALGFEVELRLSKIK